MYDNCTHLFYVIKEELNRERDSIQIAAKRVLKRFLLDNQLDRVDIDKENKVIKIDLNEKEECIIKYETKIQKNKIEEYSKEKIILKTAELHNKEEFIK